MVVTVVRWRYHSLTYSSKLGIYIKVCHEHLKRMIKCQSISFIFSKPIWDQPNCLEDMTARASTWLRDGSDDVVNEPLGQPKPANDRAFPTDWFRAPLSVIDDAEEDNLSHPKGDPQSLGPATCKRTRMSRTVTVTSHPNATDGIVCNLDLRTFAFAIMKRGFHG